MSLIDIGELAKSLSSAFKAEYKQIPCQEWYAFWNQLESRWTALFVIAPIGCIFYEMMHITP